MCGESFVYFFATGVTLTCELPWVYLCSAGFIVWNDLSFAFAKRLFIASLALTHLVDAVYPTSSLFIRLGLYIPWEYLVLGACAMAREDLFITTKEEKWMLLGYAIFVKLEGVFRRQRRV
jgi:hypothetical protein